MLRNSMRVLPFALVVSGCSPEPADLITVALFDTTSIELDSDCYGDCIDEVSAQVTFEENIAVDIAEEISVGQYKVEYAFDGYEISPFAEATSLSITSGSIGYFDFYPASWEQQDEVYAAVGGDSLTGTATLTIQGNSWDGQKYSVSTDFTISFEDLAED